MTKQSSACAFINCARPCPFQRAKPSRLLPALLSLLLVGAGCTSNLLKQPAPAKDYFAIEPGAPAASSDAVANGATPGTHLLQVRPVRVAPPYDGVSFIYRTGPAQYESDYYNQFIAAPSAMLTGSLVDWLSKAGPLPIVGGGAMVHSDLVLDGEVTKLLIDFSDKSNPRAVIAARFFLTRTNPQTGDLFILADAAYEQDAPLPSNTPAGYAAAWGQAYRQILQGLAADLRPALAHAVH